MGFAAGHFGEWLQGRWGPQGPVALITLCCPGRGARAKVHDAEALRISGGAGVLSEERLEAFLELLALPTAIHVALELDFPPGGGAGMSTAALVAVARALGREGTGVAEACCAVEGATDPLTLAAPDHVLWAPREAKVLDPEIGAPPQAEIVGGFWGDPKITVARDEAFADVSDLIEAWRAASGVAEKAALASASAERCTVLRGPDGDPMADLASALGALGHVRAHTGSARGLVFAPGTVPRGALERLKDAGLSQVFSFETEQAP